MACCMAGMAPTTWQQAWQPSRPPDSSLHRDDNARPHGTSPQPPRVSTTPIDVPTYLGTSPRLRRAGWAATKAAQSRGTSPAAAPDPTMRHWPCDASNTSNDMFMPSGTSLGVLNAGLMTPRWAETAGTPPNGSIAPHSHTSSTDVRQCVWSPRHVVWTLNMVRQPGTRLQPCPRPHDSSLPL